MSILELIELSSVTEGTTGNLDSHAESNWTRTALLLNHSAPESEQCVQLELFTWVEAYVNEAEESHAGVTVASDELSELLESADPDTRDVGYMGMIYWRKSTGPNPENLTVRETPSDMVDHYAATGMWWSTADEASNDAGLALEYMDNVDEYESFVA